MAVPSLARQRACYYFRDRLAGIYPSALDHYSLSDFRPLWREANCRALTWRKRPTKSGATQPSNGSNTNDRPK